MSKRDFRTEKVSIVRETSEMADEFFKLHADGAARWGVRWLNMNEQVVREVQSSRVISSDDIPKFRLLFSRIAYRICRAVYGSK